MAVAQWTKHTGRTSVFRSEWLWVGKGERIAVWILAAQRLAVVYSSIFQHIVGVIVSLEIRAVVNGSVQAAVLGFKLAKQHE
jgi:hypothetical protein